MRSFYEILGVSRNASSEEILIAYRKRVIESHPDHGGNPLDFLNVRKGYEILSDEKKRAEYDRWLAQKEAKERVSSEPSRQANPVAVEARTRLMPYVGVLLELYCESRKLKECIFEVYKKADDVFLNIDLQTDHSIQAAIVINRCVSKIRNAHIFQWKDILDRLVANCDSIIQKKSSYKYGKTKETQGKNDVMSFLMVGLLGCIILVVGFLKLAVNFSEEKEIPNVSQTDSIADADDGQKESTNKSKRLILYEALTKDGYDLGTYNSFCSKIDDSTHRRNFYKIFSRYYELGSYEEFSNKLDEDLTDIRKVVEDNPYRSNLDDDYNGLDYVETNFYTGSCPYIEYFGRGNFEKESLSELTILNYSNNDAVVLLCTLGNRVVRNVFVGQNSSYTMKNIPEGKYIVKIMSGKSWNKEKNNGPGFPKGGFMKNVSFSKTEEYDPFDYTFERDRDGIKYPTYSITLHKVKNGNLHTKNISEEDFFS